MLSFRGLLLTMWCSAIDNIDVVLSEIAEGVEEVTGLKVHILLGGPEPRRDGRLVTFSSVFFFVILIVFLHSI